MPFANKIYEKVGRETRSVSDDWSSKSDLRLKSVSLDIPSMLKQKLDFPGACPWQDIMHHTSTTLGVSVDGIISCLVNEWQTSEGRVKATYQSCFARILNHQNFSQP